MTRKILAAIAAAACLTSTAAVADGHMDGEEHPPMLVLMPPPDVEKPDGVEMTGDPEEDFRMVRRVFFDMMDTDGDNRLSREEMRDWVHPPMMGPPGDHGDMGEHMDGPGGDASEHVRQLEEELERLHRERMEDHRREMAHHRERIAEEVRHLREEQQRIAEHLREMEEEGRRIEEEMQQMGDGQGMGMGDGSGHDDHE